MEGEKERTVRQKRSLHRRSSIASNRKWFSW